MGIALEIIEWMDQGSDEMIHRIPEKGTLDIKLGAQVVVRDSQSAVFFKSGKATDALGPGRHTLTTLNIPVLTRLLSLPWGFKSIIRCEVYFVNHKIFTDLKWGTKDPVAFRDRELGLIRLRGYGAYTMRIVEPLVFLNSVVGRQALFSTEQIQSFLRDIVIARLNDLFGEKLDTILDLPKQYTEFAKMAKEIIAVEFSKYGLELLDFYISSITPPPEVQKRIDEKAGMEAVGNLDDYLKFSMAKAFGGGGEGTSPAEAGAGLGLGAGIAMLAPGFLSKAFAPEQTDLRPESIPTITCPKCGIDTPAESRYCYKCGYQIAVERRCSNCSREVITDAKYCPFCGHELDKEEKIKCSNCGKENPPGTKFCTECGEKIE
ncbi:MAG TPA: SPFH domain-containing protein [candidate division Zixibacteria bacterium]|nr:SPFH domain-containing protein [candidate division Zixibacteria bacterium]